VQREDDESRPVNLVQEVPMPVAPTVQKHATTQAFADQERLLAQTNRSGVRAIATPRVPDESGIELSNESDIDQGTVTKVQPAIDLDALLAQVPPPSIPPIGSNEITERVVLPVNPLVPTVETARFDTRVMSQLLADATAAHEASVAAAHEASVATAQEREAPHAQEDERTTTPPRRRSVVRKFFAALLVVLIMGGAFVLLVVAASRAERQLPPHIVHAAQRLIELTHR
jgi:hypothetical protein